MLKRIPQSIIPAFLIFVCAVTDFGTVMANDVQVQTRFSEAQILTGERVTVTIEVQGRDFRNVGRPEIPANITGLRPISLQPSVSTRYSLVNGQSTRTHSYSYSYVADSPGTFEFPAVPVNVDGEQMMSSPVRFTVVNRGEQRTASGSDRPNVFIQVEVSEQQPVVGQQLISELVLYFRPDVDIVSYQVNTNWSTDGFWKESLSDGTNPRAESVILGGERFRRAVLVRHALFPSRSGDLRLGEARITATVRNTGRQNDPFGGFFGGFGTNQRTVELRSDAKDIRVRPLPASGDRKTIGAVGDFRIDRRVSPTSVMAGEAVEIITEIRGSGNLGLIRKPAYTFPEVFEVFQPQETMNLERSQAGISGLRIFRDIVIIRRPGTFEVPAQEISWYNPDRRRYQSVTLPAQQITVTQDPAGAAAIAGQQRTLQITPVSGVVRWTSAGRSVPLTAWWLWAGLMLPAIVLGWAWMRRQEITRLQTDSGYARKKYAAQNAAKLLNQAEELAGSPSADVKSVMGKLQSAVYQVVTDRLGLPEAGHSDETILRAIEQSGVNGEHLDNTRKLLKKCSTIRFAPVIARENLEFEVQKTKELVKHLGEKL